MARRVIRAHVARGTIPGVNADGEGLVRGRDVPAVQAERSRAARRAGATNGADRSQDGLLRSYGVPVFDRHAGQGELNGYIVRGNGKR
jgi:hypothetical protein